MATKPLTQTTGRRKEAVARARLRPGTGTHTVNGKAFDAYFTTAMQRMTVTEALRVTETESAYDIDATMHGGGISGQAGALRMAIARSLVELDPEARAGAEEGRPAHPRPTSQGEQEVRPQEGPQGPSVHQALSEARPWASFGSEPMECAGVCPTNSTPATSPDWRAPRHRCSGPGPWLIGQDTRESSSALAHAFGDGLAASGADSADGQRRADTGAGRRRRPPRPAGGDDHRLAQPVVRQRREDLRPRRARSSPMTSSGPSRQPSAPMTGSPADSPARRCSSRSSTCTWATISRSSPTRPWPAYAVVLDCANGAMFEAAPLVARRLGADVTVIHAEPSGRNINDHCGATHPDDLRRAVVDLGADLGLAFDGDGDRVIAVDHRGNIVDGDRMLALAALQLRDEGQLTGDTVVVTVMSNLGFHKAMGAAGINVDHHPGRRSSPCSKRSTPVTMRSAASRAGTSSIAI